MVPVLPLSPLASVTGNCIKYSPAIKSNTLTPLVILMLNLSPKCVKMNFAHTDFEQPVVQLGIQFHYGTSICAMGHQPCSCTAHIYINQGRGRETYRGTDRQTDRDRDRETERERQTETDRERERERDRQRQTERERERDTDRDRKRDRQRNR